MGALEDALRTPDESPDGVPMSKPEDSAGGFMQLIQWIMNALKSPGPGIGQGPDIMKGIEPTAEPTEDEDQLKKTLGGHGSAAGDEAAKALADEEKQQRGK